MSERSLQIKKSILKLFDKFFFFRQDFGRKLVCSNNTISLMPDFCVASAGKR